MFIENKYRHQISAIVWWRQRKAQYGAERNAGLLQNKIFELSKTATEIALRDSVAHIRGLYRGHLNFPAYARGFTPSPDFAGWNPNLLQQRAQ